VLRSGTAPRYSRCCGDELLSKAVECGADLLRTLDYSGAHHRDFAATHARHGARHHAHRLDGDQLDAAIGEWATTRTEPSVGTRRAVAIDGKTVRGSPSGSAEGNDVAARHLLAAIDHHVGVVLGQVEVQIVTRRVLGGLVKVEWGWGVCLDHGGVQGVQQVVHGEFGRVSDGACQASSGQFGG
jgi:hypothetical protein